MTEILYALFLHDLAVVALVILLALVITATASGEDE